MRARANEPLARAACVTLVTRQLPCDRQHANYPTTHACSVCSAASTEAEMSTRSLVKAATTTESGRPSAARLLSQLNSASSSRRLRPHRSSRVRAHPFAPRASFCRPCRWWTQQEAHEHGEAAPDRFSATATALGQQPAAMERVSASPRRPHSGRTAASSTSPSLRFLSKDSRFRE